MITIVGGIISRQKDSNITFKLKCEKCGCENQPETTITVTQGITEITTKQCVACGNKQTIKMKHVMN